MAWEVFNYPGGLSTAEQEEWLDDIGLLDYFDFSTDSTTTILTTKIAGATSADNRAMIQFNNLQNEWSATQANKPLLSYFKYRRADAGTDTISFSIMTNSYISLADTIVFKKMQFGEGKVLWNISEVGDATHNANVVFFTDASAVTIDDATTPFAYIAAVNEYKICTAYRVMLTDTAEVDQGSNANAYYYESRNQGSVKYILQPFYIKGIKTGFYTIDGGQNRLAFGTETIIQGKKIFVMNQGLVIEEA